MSDAARPNEPAPYITRCENMTVDELGDFILDSLKRRADLDPGRPHKEEEFRSLHRVLRDKNRAANPPKNPERYDPDARLRSLQAKRQRLLIRQQEAHGAPSTKKRDIDQMQLTLEKLEQEIDQLRYRTHPLYFSLPPNLPDGDHHSEMVAGVLKEINRVFRPDIALPTIHLPWELAPSGSASPSSLRREFGARERQDRLRADFDPERLEKLILLDPQRRYVGRRKFEGYSIFTFANTSKALMECFRKGNAIFVLPARPDQWPQDKQELREHPSVVWIPHQGDWFARVQQELGIDASAEESEG